MRVIVTGETGKLSKQIKKQFENKHNGTTVILLSVRNDEWQKYRYKDIDIVIHCAGLIGDNSTTEDEYYSANVMITKQVLEFAHLNKVKHFIYISSMAVYDAIPWGFGQDGIITNDTIPLASSNYGKSKLMAENVIFNSRDLIEGMKISVIRAPSIVGNGMESYFASYEKLMKIPFVVWSFIEAKRSFVYVDTLVDFLYSIILEGIEGVQFPQNLPMLSVSEIWYEIVKCKGLKRSRIHIPEKAIPNRFAKKIFRQICYAEDLSIDINLKNNQISSYEAIQRCMNE